MRICQSCGQSFRDFYIHDGTILDFSRRKHCVECRPIVPEAPARPKAQAIVRPKVNQVQEDKVFECAVCSKPLEGRQSKFCSVECKVQFHSSYPKQKDRAIVRKLRLVEIAGGACSICGYNKNIANLHFHHLDPSKKSFQLDARAISNHGWAIVLEEFAKCIMVCSNCHFELHHPELVYEELKARYIDFKVS